MEEMERNPYFVIENDRNILEFKNNLDEPIWFYMRRLILELLDEKTIGKYVIHDTRDNNILNILRYAVKSSLHNIFYKPQKSKIIFYSVFQAIYENNEYYNKYIDPYVDCVKDYTLTIEAAPLDWRYEKNRHNKDVIFCGPNLIISEVLSKFLSKYDKTNRKNAEELVEFASLKCEELLNVHLTNAEKKIIVDGTIKIMSRAKLHSTWILKRCRRSGAKCLIMIGASYLWNSAIVRKLKGNGIQVADLQHGYIFNDNLVYDVSSGICQDGETKKSAPNYLLTYGKWWNEQSNLPYQQKIALGNPYREDKIKEFNNTSSKNVILLIGTGVNTDDHILLAEFLGNKFGSQYEVVLRPHPTERIYMNNKLGNRKLLFTLDCEKDLYSTLERTKILIGKSSTVLFEAYGLVNQIIIWNDFVGQKLFKEDFFSHFDNFEQLPEIIMNGENSRSDIAFWENDSRKQYRAFYDSI